MAPFGALPLLQACLRRAGHEVLVLDAAALAFRWLARRESVAELYAYARSIRAPALREGFERRLAVPEELALAAEPALGELRDPAVFFDPERARERWDAVHAIRELFAFLHPPFDPRNRDFTPRLHAHLALRDPAWPRIFDAVLRAPLAAFGPELVALSVPFSTQVATVFELGRWVHARFPGVPVAAGGTSFSDAETVLLGEPRTFDFVDLVCTGDGEDALVELAAALEGRFALESVSGLHRRTPAGALVPPRERRLADLDARPTPDFGGIDFSLYLTPEKIALLTTSRGCYYGKCTFCPESFRLSYRRRSSPLVWEDVRHIAREQGITNFFFWDPLTPPAALAEVSARAAAEGLDIAFAAEVKFEAPYADRAHVQALARGGCRFLLFGFESGVQHVLDAMQKGNDLAEVDGILARLAEARIAVGTFFFIGFPTELEDEARETWRYLARRRDEVAFCAYVGTFGMGEDVPVFRDPQRYGIELVRTPGGDPAYRRLDGRDWDPEPLHRAFAARSDVELIHSGAALLYARRHPERVPALRAVARTGPPVFARPLTAGDALRVPPRNGFRFAEGGQRSHAFVARSSLVHELAPEDVELLRAVLGGADARALLARPEPWVPARLARLLDAGILDRAPLRAEELPPPARATPLRASGARSAAVPRV